MNREARQINHSLLFVTLIALSLTLLTGCLSLAPSRRHREEATARAANELVAHGSKLERATFLAAASDCPASFEVSSNGHNVDFHFVGPNGFYGLATGISEDGYLITAAHLVTRREHCYVVGWMDGKPAVFPARVVYKKLGRKFGEDLAILHVDKHLDGPIPLGTLDSAESEIYAFAYQQSGREFIVMAGKVVRRPKPNPGKDMSIMATDLPLWKGDSGGGVMSKDGKLVGVFIGVDLGWSMLKNSAIVCVPDMDRVLSLIAKDRQKANEPAKSLQPTDAAPAR